MSKEKQEKQEKKKKQSKFSKEELDQILKDAWLDIKVDEKKLFNPLKNVPSILENDPHLYITWLFTRPEYFSFFCKEILNIYLLPIQAVILKELWIRKFPMLIASRGGSKSFLLGLYSLLRMTFIPGRKIVICGSGFRQSKIIFNYMESIWDNAPLFRDMIGSGSGPKHETDVFRFHVGESVAQAIPVGSGEKIRGLRAHDLLVDEFSSITREIFETVMSGFLSVKASPAESVKEQASVDLANKLGIEFDVDTDSIIKQNQLIISGTASYDFNHFAEYWKRWKKIILSKGDPEKLAQAFSSMEDIPPGLNWKDYSIIRIPYTLLPRGFLDDAMIARSKATIHSGIFAMEFMSIFSKDSTGFFKRSLIESCVTNANNPIEHKSGLVRFSPVLSGDPKLRCVYGIDPASEIDNFAVVVLELHPDHRRIVYVWTTTRKEHREKLKSSLVKDVDFYGYCVRKIRSLMKVFPCERIMIDSQGGGIAVSESLHDKLKLEVGEHLIWPVIDYSKPKDTDVEAGLHIVEMVNFSSSEWVSQANHGLRKDFEDKLCLFPQFDPAIIELASIKDQYEGISYDTLEDCIMEIEELKNELSTIIIEQSSFGRDRWTTPEIRLPGNKKGRLRKDRYSALVMANMGARTLMTATTPNYYLSEGNFVAHIKEISGKSYQGPDWFTSQMEGVYD